MNGDGVARNQETAVEFLKAAAKAGQIDAQFELGLCYTEGKGVEKDETKLIRWLTTAAEQNHLEAQYQLGNYYKSKKDLAKATAWLRRASGNGHLGAEKLLHSINKDSGTEHWKKSPGQSQSGDINSREKGTGGTGKKDNGPDKKPGGGDKR